MRSKAIAWRLSSPQGSLGLSLLLPLTFPATVLQSSYTFWPPLDMTLVCLSSFMLLLFGMMHHCPTLLLNILNPEDLSGTVWETIFVPVSLLRPQVYVLFLLFQLHVQQMLWLPHPHPPVLTISVHTASSTCVPSLRGCLRSLGMQAGSARR